MMMTTVGFARSKLIARLKAIAALSDADAALIASFPMRVQNLPDKGVIASDGERVKQCCLLLEGYLTRQKTLADGTRQIVSWHVPGDIPDLYSLHLTPIDHDLVTLGPAIVALIQHEHMNAVLQQSASLTHIFWRETLVDAAVFREWVIDLGKRSALERIAHTICEVYRRLEVVGLVRNGGFTFPASQVEISDATGMTPVHCNRMVQQLRAQGVLQWEGSNVFVPDMSKLEKIAKFDEAYLHLREHQR
jgi:CRP-like cAMP-binding protein